MYFENNIKKYLQKYLNTSVYLVFKYILSMYLNTKKKVFSAQLWSLD